MHNCIAKELRVIEKGMSEDIFAKCEPNSSTDNLDKIIFLIKSLTSIFK